ncbi:hypothetical protein G4Y79_19680 [Phototrophicus methaneseepsis]|uniref:Methyltransferase domain-containing protein n=1 Tax=Phototrophicus methaneseepsis TaxID=2710758 RepID=A0A7S8E7R6_9CHLR|nr:hypothetical protein [Phototrophicus methaneseepsis]QPC81887.1 hypothetical protein G4Y79_19680 [Phototrophicus methaneseepsis]
MNQERYIEAMAKHLPPSAAELRLFDVGGVAGRTLRSLRPDLNVTVTSLNTEQWAYPEAVADAVSAYDIPLQADLMAAVLRLLRPGGRFILVNPFGTVDESLVHTLQGAGYVRILVEAAVEGQGVLIRGERVHDTADTLARVQGVAGRDADVLDLATYRGRYVHLLVRQTPNKPVWRLTPEDVLTWEAAAIRQGDDVLLLGFSSLPKAVGLMQPAVLAYLIHGVNKVGKFSKDVAASWPHGVLLNPTLDHIQHADIQFIDIDPQTAEAPDE